MERFKSPEQPGLTVRFHHLELWNEIVDEYLQDFNQVKPWDLKEKDRPLLIDFAHKCMSGMVMNEVTWQEKFEDLADKNSMENFGYISDLIGMTAESRAVFESRSGDYLAGIFSEAGRNVEAKVVLTLNNDGYCNACFVGNHCKRKIPAFLTATSFDKDLICEDALLAMIKDKKFTNEFGEQIIEKRGQIILPAGLLFNLSFYDSLKNVIRNRYSLDGFNYWLGMDNVQY